MKKLILIGFAALAVAGCTKEPKACMEISPGKTVEVFQDITLTSCSENAEFIEWDVEERAFLFNINNSYNGEVATHRWDASGTFTVQIKAISKNEKKQDELTETVEVVDVCYECINSSNFSSEICTNQFMEKSEFDNEISFYRSNGYTCTKK